MWTDNILTSGVNYPVAAFLNAPTPTYIGESSGLFTLYLSAATSDDHYFDLYSEFSRSSPLITDPTKWSHLIPQWRFKDVNGNVITRIKTDDVATVVGSTTAWLGSAQFYYIDDTATLPCEPVLIWAVLDITNNAIESDVRFMSVTSNSNIPGYANSKVAAVAPYFILDKEPTMLEITRDGQYPLFDYYWKNSIIPYIISVKNQAGVSYPILFNIPLTETCAISDGNFDQGVTSLLNPNSAIFDPTYIRLSAIDSDGFSTGGFAVGNVSILETTSNATITAGINITYYDIVDSDGLWVANPNNNKLHKIGKENCITDTRLAEISTVINNFELGGGSVYINSYDTPYITTLTPGDMGLSGFGGIYGIAIDSEGSAWCTDIEMNSIYKWNTAGVLLSTIDLTSYDVSARMPAGISINSEDDIWISLFESVSVLKIDHTTGSILSAIQPGLDYNKGPILVETDFDDNIWVSYSNVTASNVYKFDGTNGSLLSTVFLEVCSCPFDMLIADNSSLWITYTYDVADILSGSIIKLNTTSGAVISSISLAYAPRYIAPDGSGGIWITYDTNSIRHYDSNGNITIIPSVGTTGDYDTLKESYLDGIALDNYGRINVVHTVDNIVYTYDALTGDYVRQIGLIPDNNIEWIITSTGVVSAFYSEYNKSARAFGDWAGTRRLIKYETFIPSSTTSVPATAYLTGSSNSFEIRDFQNYNIRRFNESEDITNNMREMVYPAHIKENPVLFDSIIGSTFSTASSEDGIAFGRQYFEKTANFVQNHIDIDTCNINQLYSLAEQFNVPIDIYNVTNMPNMQKIMDIISVNQQVLWGTRCGCNKNITNKYKEEIINNELTPIEYLCEKCNHYHAGNRGELFDPATYMVSAFVPFIVEERAAELYTLVIPPPSSTGSMRVSAICNPSVTENQLITSYSLLDGLNFLVPGASASEIYTRYCFFDYIDIACDDQVAGLIDWDNEHNTLNETLSTTQNWFNVNTGTVETILNYILQQGLGLINE